MAIKPPSHVKNEPYWQGELARRSAPVVIPGGDPLGAALVLLFNPSVFLDKHNYSYAEQEEPAMDGAEMLHKLITTSPACPVSTSHKGEVCAEETGSLYQHILAH